MFALVAQLVEHCLGMPEMWVRNPSSAPIAPFLQILSVSDFNIVVVVVKDNFPSKLSSYFPKDK